MDKLHDRDTVRWTGRLDEKDEREGKVKDILKERIHDMTVGAGNDAERPTQEQQKELNDISYNHLGWLPNDISNFIEDTWRECHQAMMQP